MKKLFLLLAILPFFSSAHANLNELELDKLVNDFYSQKSQKHHPRDCRPRSGSCLETACNMMGTFECSDMDEVDQVITACRGMWGDECLRVSTRYLSDIEYNRLDEMVPLIHSCRGLYDMECTKVVCEMRRLGCNDLEEVIAVNKRCSGAM